MLQLKQHTRCAIIPRLSVLLSLDRKYNGEDAGSNDMKTIWISTEDQGRLKSRWSWSKNRRQATVVVGISSMLKRLS